jgi:hypothetical protein
LIEICLQQTDGPQATDQLPVHVMLPAHLYVVFPLQNELVLLASTPPKCELHTRFVVLPFC